MAATGFAAAQCALCDGAHSDQYPAKTSSQLTRGLANVGFGWLELFRQPIKASSEGRNPLAAVPDGFKAAGDRMAGGVGETMVSPAPTGTEPLAHDCPFGVVGATDR